MSPSDVLSISDPAASYQADRDALVAVLRSHDADGWSAPSGCAGWSVLDVANHLAILAWTVADPTRLAGLVDEAELAGASTEDGQELLVQARRSWAPDAVLADLDESTTACVAGLTFLRAGGDTPLDVGALGTYPLWAVPAAMSFDVAVHTRLDLEAPRGPWPAGTLPVLTAAQVPAAIEWIGHALPQHSPAALAALGGGLEVVAAEVPDHVVVAGETPSVRVTGPALGLLAWVTTRRPFDECGLTVEGEADPAALAMVHVF